MAPPAFLEIDATPVCLRFSSAKIAMKTESRSADARLVLPNCETGCAARLILR
jgi:hypothetical protein